MTTDIPVPTRQYCHFCGQGLIRKQWEGRLRPYCVHCDIPIYENPIPATATVVCDRESGLLLVKRKVPPRKGEWALAGGFMELHEVPEQAALRELNEETGITGKIETLLGVTAHNSVTYGTILIVGYLVNDYQGSPLAGDDAEQVTFFHPEELPEIAFDSHRLFIHNALKYLGSPVEPLIS